MDVKKIVLLVGALLIAAVTAVMAKNMFTGAGSPQAEAAVVAGPEVLVATRSLPVGTIMDATAFRYQPWPEGLVQPAYFMKGTAGGSPQDLLGTVVRTEITAGQPITNGALVKPGDRGFLAAALSPGMRAVTVSVNKTASVAGFIFPGDRVDMVLTQEVVGEGGGVSLKVSETILRNMRVLATNQRTESKDAEGKTVVTDIELVTLETTPKMAEKIAVAQTIGKLSLSLRALADNTAELERAIASGEIDIPEGADPKEERKMILSLASKPSDSGTTFTVGADVSRYQRGSVPVKPREQILALGPPAQAGGYAPARPSGPVVRIARGNSVTEVPIGAR
ncbi:MAG: Flp pilus assembly protein CpaB [Sphingosinicella sp.]|nr:Flp pilus assembly protein CpaB [Sphingosinicella sp.]